MTEKRSVEKPESKNANLESKKHGGQNKPVRFCITLKNTERQYHNTTSTLLETEIKSSMSQWHGRPHGGEHSGVYSLSRKKRT